MIPDHVYAFAYRIEALVPSLPGAATASQAPQSLGGNRDISFGSLGDKMLVAHMTNDNVGGSRIARAGVV